jgi:quercetin dioxygenase-like cupin family protein
MKTYPFKTAQEVFRQDHSTGHLVAATEQADVVLLNLEPGDHIPAHTLNIGVLFAVASGSAHLTSGEETAELVSGDVAEVAPGELREWANSTEKPCRIFVMKQKA